MVRAPRPRTCAGARSEAAGSIARLMANIKSQIKRNKQNDKRAEKNKAVRTSLKTSTKKVRSAVASGDAEAATAQALETSRALDKAASKGIVHKRTAARRKSAWRRPPTRSPPRPRPSSAPLRSRTTLTGGDRRHERGHDHVAARARLHGPIRLDQPFVQVDELPHRVVPRLLLVAPRLPVEPQPGRSASSAGGIRSGSARTFIRSRSRLAMPPSTISASSPPSSIERQRADRARQVLAERAVAQIPDLLLAQPAELLRDDQRRHALAGEAPMPAAGARPTSCPGSSPSVSTRACSRRRRDVHAVALRRAAAATAPGPCARSSPRDLADRLHELDERGGHLARARRPARRSPAAHRGRATRGTPPSSAIASFGRLFASVTSSARGSPKSDGVARSCSSPPCHSPASTSVGFSSPSRSSARSRSRNSSSPQSRVTDVVLAAGLIARIVQRSPDSRT